MAENMQALATIDVKGALSADGPTAYSSLRSGTIKEKAALYNAMSNPKHKVGDYINKTIMVKDVYVEVVEIEDIDENGVKTGGTITAPRIVLVDTKGETYQAVSKGVFNALGRLFRTFGEPTWEDGLPLTVVQISLGKNQMLTLEVDEKAL